MLGIVNGLLNLVGSDYGVTSQQCKDVLANTFDGENALQHVTYTINQGDFENRTILAFMGTDFTNIEQIVADIWSTPMSTDLIKTMAEEAKRVAESMSPPPDYITGHSLGGIIAEMVCSMTGIPGASFGAIGAFDPFTRIEENDLFGTGTDYSRTKLSESYATSLQRMGYDDDEIQELISTLSVEQLVIRTDYNGLILDTKHDGVEFEVVMNVHDIPARTISSNDGSACSHIASSCDIRWTWFGGNPFYSKTLGHSSTHYAFNTNLYYTRGYEDISLAKENQEGIFLPGTTKNTLCDFCDRNEYCESGACNTDTEKCVQHNFKLPTFCPEDSSENGARAACDRDEDCSSNRCEAWPILGWGLCHEKVSNNDWCNEDTDCASGYCNWSFVCANKKQNGEGCVEHDDCVSNYCSWWYRCSN